MEQSRQEQVVLLPSGTPASSSGTPFRRQLDQHQNNSKPLPAGMNGSTTSAGPPQMSHFKLLWNKNVDVHWRNKSWMQFACAFILVLFFGGVSRFSSLLNRPITGSDEYDIWRAAVYGPGTEKIGTEGGGAILFFGPLGEGISLWAGVFIPLSIVYRIFGSQIFIEKETQLMEMQFVYGLSKVKYWLSNLLFFGVVLGGAFLLAQVILVVFESKWVSGAVTRDWTSGEIFSLGLFLAPVFPVVAALALGSTFAVVYQQKEKFESFLNAMGLGGSLIALALLLGVEFIAPTKTSWIRVGSSALFSDDVSDCPDTSLTWLNNVFSLLFGILLPGYSFAKINYRGMTMRYVYLGMKIQYPNGLPPTGLPGYAGWGCALRNDPRPPGVPPVGTTPLSVDETAGGSLTFGIVPEPVKKALEDELNNDAGMSFLAKHLSFGDITLPILIDYVALILNVVFWLGALYRCEKRRHQAEQGEVAAEDDYNAVSSEMVHHRRSGAASAVQLARAGTTNDKPALVLQNLSKSFKVPHGTITANKDLSFEIQRGEIFGLLGHNGAGKTTLISQITGMIPCTSGNAFVNGYSIRDNDEIGQVRQNIALCPQANPMWENYTMRQHIQFFARLKQIPEEEVEATILKYARLLNVEHKLDTICEKLSGGQKRRLWVICALLGSAPVVILDEPTSGMDPQARRDFWAFLKKLVKEEKRSILFSTHYLEEADLLADRKIIIAMGKKAAIGTSQELKRQFGEGFWIQATVDKSKCLDKNEAREILHVQLKEVVRSSLNTTNFIKTKNPKVSEYFLAFCIPWEEIEKLGDILDRLSEYCDSKESLKSKNIEFTVEQTTLEEVFSIAGERAELEKLREEQDDEEQVEQTMLEKKQQEQRDQQLSRMPLRKRETSFFSSAAAVLRFRLTGQNFLRPGSYISMLILFGIFIAVSVLVEHSQGTENPGLWANLFATSLNGLFLGMLPFQLLGLNIIRNHYDKERSHGLLRHLTMHGVSRSSFHSGSFLSWFLFPTGLGWLLFTIILMVYFSKVLASTWTIALVFFVLYAVITASSNILYPMWIGVALPGKYWFVVLIMLGWLIGLLPAMLAGALFNAGDVSPTCQNVGLVVSAFAQAPGNALNFQIPVWWSVMWFFLGLPFPAVGSANAFAGLYKLWAFDKAVTSFSWIANYQNWPTLVNEFGLNPLDPSTWPVRVDPQGQVVSFNNELMSKIYYETSASQSLSYYLFGTDLEVPSFIPGTDNPVQPLANRLVDEFMGQFRANTECGQSGLTQAAFLQVLMPVWSFFLVVLFFVLHHTCCLRRKMRKNYGARRNVGANGDVDLPRKEPAEERDLDVVAEENRERSVNPPDTIDIRDVYKHFKNPGSDEPNWATKGVTLGIPAGECFGLLGPNGAGKTTLFNLMSGSDEIGGPDAGAIFIQGKEALDDYFESSRKIMGLAPQFDKLWPDISGRRHLRLFAKCCGTYYPPKGMNKTAGGALGGGGRQSADELDPESQRLLSDNEKLYFDYGEERISRFLREVSLSEKDADRKVLEYSGGMKRKLSVALTLITDPELVYLDEMSAGVDIVAQRSLWNKILHRPEGQTIITTTHSMAEADAVSDRVGVLVAGRLKCLGETSHIKDVYGSGYHLELTCDLSKQDDKFVPQTITVQNVEEIVIASLLHHLKIGDDVTIATAKKKITNSFQLQRTKSSLLESGMIEEENIKNNSDETTAQEPKPFELLEKIVFSEHKVRLILAFKKQNNSATDNDKPLQKIMKRNIKISEVFRWVIKDELKIIEDYGLGEPSLEQVFLRFAKVQEEMDAEKELLANFEGTLYYNPFTEKYGMERVVFDQKKNEWYDIEARQYYDQDAQAWYEPLFSKSPQ
ncbi:unnamed protein product [Amoebophrya sp. A120]|nr:unnamed protein product [Amoebophrya sp. A120]|eukprot:GSA120T00009688001.1